MITIVVHKNTDIARFKEDMTDLGVTYKHLKAIRVLFYVDIPIKDFPLTGDPRIKSVTTVKKHPYVPQAVTTQVLTDIMFDRFPTLPVGTDSWGLARHCRRRNPFSITRPPKTGEYASTYRYSRTGLGVDVYVIDDSIELEHPELIGRVERIDGVVGDTNLFGLNTAVMHGIASSSCAAGTLTGFAKDALVFTHIISPYQNDDTGYIIALDSVLAHYQSRSGTNRPAVINFSYGQPGTVSSPAMVAALDAVVDDGMIICIAAGNFSQDLDIEDHAPGDAIPDSVTVGATTIIDTPMYLTSQSPNAGQYVGGTNYGTEVDIYAAGTNTTMADRLHGYKHWSGTSFACPYVAGVLACMLQGYGRLSNRAEVNIVVNKLYANSTKDVIVAPANKPYRIDNNRLLYIDPNITIEEFTGLTPL